MNKFSQRWHQAAFCALLGSICFTTIGAQAATPKPPGLFSASPVKKSTVLPARAIAGKSNAVKVNHGRLRSGRVFLDLPGGVSLEAVRDLQQDLGGSRYAWVGRANGDSRSRVVIGVSGESMAGTIAYKGKLYRLEPRKDGSHIISEMESGDPAPEMDPIPVADIAGFSPVGDSASAADGGQTIDVMVAYTPRLLDIYGEAGTDALIIQAVAETNQAYANSGISPRLNLVASVLADYTESGSMNTDLSRLQGTSDGYMDELHALRDSYGADLVTLIEDEPQYCGLAYMMTGLSTGFASTAFSVIHHTCATGYYSFAHELGHNQGINHDPANAGTALYPYAYGHQEPFGAFRTVMAYNCSGGCSRVDYFSNPDVLFSGQPTGVSDLSDNARALNNTAATVASFRQVATQSPPSAPDELNATAAGQSEISLTWQDTSDEESGFRLERSTNGVDFVEIAELAANTNSYFDDSLLPDTVYNYRIQAWNSVGNSGYSPSATVVTEPAPSVIEQTATADIAVAGKLSGSYLDTWSDDGVYQTIVERRSKRQNRTRYSYLEHKWTVSIEPGNVMQLYADVSTSADSDAFTFSYSTDNSSFVDMFTVDVNSSGMQQFMLPSSLSGTLYIRVTDDVRTPGILSSNSVQVDQLMVRSESGAGDAPSAPGDLTAIMAGSNEVDVNWSDLSDNELGFTMERRIDSSSAWLHIGTVGAGVTSYNDSGLASATLYHYRVRAFNGAGESANSNTTSSVTDSAGNIDLSATGYKIMAKQKVDLTWSGTQSASVDIYRDDALVAGSVDNTGAYTDNINVRGGGSYSYEICEAGTTTCSNSMGVVF